MRLWSHSAVVVKGEGVGRLGRFGLGVILMVAGCARSFQSIVDSVEDAQESCALKLSLRELVMSRSALRQGPDSRQRLSLIWGVSGFTSDSGHLCRQLTFGHPKKTHSPHILG